MVIYNRKEDSVANSFQLPNVTVVERHLRASGAKFPLLVEFNETNDSVLCVIEFNTSLLSRRLIDGLKAKMPFIINTLHQNESLEMISPDYLEQGKTDRLAAESPATVTSQAKVDTVRRAFAGALGLELGHISCGKSFFDLGGSSLLCLRVQSLLKEQGVQVSIRDILPGHSAEAIAATLQGSLAHANFSS